MLKTCDYLLLDVVSRLFTGKLDSSHTVFVFLLDISFRHCDLISYFSLTKLLSVMIWCRGRETCAMVFPLGYGLFRKYHFWNLHWSLC